MEHINDEKMQILMGRGENNLKEFVKIKLANGEKLSIRELFSCLYAITMKMEKLSEVGVYMGDIKGENVLIQVICLLFIFYIKGYR